MQFTDSFTPLSVAVFVLLAKNSLLCYLKSIFVVKNTLQKEMAFLFLPCINIPLQKNGTGPRVTTNPSHSIWFNAVSMTWQMEDSAYSIMTFHSPMEWLIDAQWLSQHIIYYICREIRSCPCRQSVKAWMFAPSCCDATGWSFRWKT